eukprot:4059006-Amphidinium_carterae.1
MSRPGCQYPSFDGQPGHFCSKTCKQAATQSVQPQAKAPQASQRDGMTRAGRPISTRQTQTHVVTSTSDLVQEGNRMEPPHHKGKKTP